MPEFAKCFEDKPEEEHIKLLRKQLMKEVEESWIQNNFNDLDVHNSIVGYQDQGVKGIIKKLQHRLDFRKQWKLHDISDKIIQQETMDAFSNMIHGQDKQGHPVLYIGMGGKGAFNTEFIHENTSRVNNYIALTAEVLYGIKQKIGKELKNNLHLHIAIIDAKNVSLFDLHDIWKAVGPMMKATREAYPNGVYKLFVVNTDWKYVWAKSIADQFMEKQTVAKLTVVGEDFLHLLTEHIDIDQIPKYFGGKSDMPTGTGSISFKHFKWESDKIAKVGVKTLQLEARSKKKMNVKEFSRRARSIETGVNNLCTFAIGFTAGLIFGTIVNLHLNNSLW